jgi:hypothetical protein
MPDIQTALNNALKNTINDWEKDDMQTTQTNPQGKKIFDVTNNVTRMTFDYVKHHPNETSAEICASMERLGYKTSSVGSLLAQFAKQGLAERDDRGRYITIVPEYRPLKAKKKPLKIVPKPVETKRNYEKKEVVGIAALQPDTVEIPKRATLILRAQAPDDIIKNLSVFQARDLYDRLKQIFGG